jgi:tellurite resistance protein
MEQQSTLQMQGQGAVVAQQLRLKNFPISFFAIILGMTGTTIAFQRAQMILKFPVPVGIYLLGLTTILFLVILGVYITKFIKYPDAVKEEFNHPVRLSFFPTISISLLLLNISFLGINPTISKYLWIVGTILHAFFSLHIISYWIQNPKFQMQHFNAAWFIPVVGNIIIPVTGPDHGFLELSWFFFSIGLVFWIVLMAILFNRLIFHNPLPEKLIPTLFIMIAPPAVGFIAYGKINHEHLDNFGQILYHFALFLFALMIFQFKMFSRIKFYLSWWAYSFPIAAMTIATMFKVKLMRDACNIPGEACPFLPINFSFYTSLAYVLLGGLSLVILMLIVKTVGAMKQQQICVPED